MLRNETVKGRKSGKKRRRMRDDEKEFLRTLGVHIRSRRRELGLTQEDLSSLSGLSKISVTNIERGLTGTTLNTLLKLAGALKMSIEDFLITASAAAAVCKRETEQGSGKSVL